MNGLRWAEENMNKALLERLQGPLPQRRDGHREGKYVDEYRFILSAKEREHLIRLLAAK